MDIKIPGIGKKTEKLLEKLQLTSAEDFLKNYPTRYEEFSLPSMIMDLSEGMQSIQVILEQSVDYSGKVPKVLAHDDTGRICIRWFHPPFIARSFKRGDCYIFVGNVTFFNGYVQMTQPQIYTTIEYIHMVGKLLPVYPLTSGITQHTLRKCTGYILQHTKISETLPKEIMFEHHLCSREEAVHWIHFPESREQQEAAYRRIVFEEFFWFRYSLGGKGKNTCVMTSSSYVDSLTLPYELTKGQKECLNKIKEKLSGEEKLNLLVQGDVGCGKTIIALLSMLIAAENGYQAVLMAPTEVLAKQHYEELSKLCGPYTCGILTSSTKHKEIYQQIEDGSLLLIVGTHALLSEKVHFHSLGLVITDEQHRFGVKQREILEEQGTHCILMSATPIPRSLGLILYGDMDIQVIQEKPANRLPVKNCVLSYEKRLQAWNFLYHQLEKGRQGYIICPMIDHNPDYPLIDLETYYKYLRDAFPEKYKIGIIHGKSKDKDEIMQDFMDNRIQILLATTVVEVGVNVPNATVMLIENADRFGMSQLHQLRGRVGRGKWQSYCIFINGSDESCERLNYMWQTNDGFLIAEQDMKMRGVGQLMGEKQSGNTDFLLADIYKDTDLLKEAADAVTRMKG